MLKNKTPRQEQLDKIVESKIKAIGLDALFHLVDEVLEGGGHDDAIILQQKETGPSVLGADLGPSTYASHAQRVVHGQRMMQAASDIFLGWHQGSLTGSYYYWRQLKDMKGSFEVAASDSAGFKSYLTVCSVCLARAHARTGDTAAILGYLGGNDSFALQLFAIADNDQRLRCVVRFG